MTPSRSSRRTLRTVSTLLLSVLLMVLTTSCAQGQNDTEALLDAMQMNDGSWVADVGSGDGDYTLPMAKRVGASGRVFAVDIDHDPLDELNEKLRENDVENVTTVYSIEDNPMLPTNTLDAVLVRNAYHHFTEHQAMLRHIRAALKPGGRLVIEESVSEDMLGESREAQVEDHDIGIGYVRDELQAAGFEIQREEDPLMETDWGIYWMIVATRPGS